MYSHSILLWVAVYILLSHQKKQRKLQCSGLTWTWWKMPSISHMTATGSWGNLHNTSTMLFVRSRPWRRCLLRIFQQFPRYSRKQLLSFSVFSGDTLHGAECTTGVDNFLNFFGWNFLRVTSADDITHKGQVICLIFAVRLEPSFQFLETFQNDFLVVMQHNWFLLEL